MSEITYSEPSGILEFGGANDVSAEINQQIATARRYPRRADKIISQEIMSRATLHEEIAAECMYAKPVGGEKVYGPSARFAEIVFASYGNLRVGARFIRIDRDDPERQAVIVEGVCLDLQSNNARIVPVRRSIMSSAKGGRRPVPFNAELTNTTAAAAASIAARESILKVVAKSIWIEAYQRVVAVLRGDQATLTERRTKAIEAFSKLGAKPPELFAALGVKDESEIGLDMMPILAGMWNAVKEGEPLAVVLGRQEQVQPAPAVRNPLADAPPELPDGPPDGATPEFALNPPATVILAEKTHIPQNTRTEPADASNPPQVSDSRPAAKPTNEPHTSRVGDDYAREAKRIIEMATVASQLRNWWGAQRQMRVNAALSAVESAELLAAYNHKYKALMAALAGDVGDEK
jgi:hypothetical protein